MHIFYEYIWKIHADKIVTTLRTGDHLF